MGKTSTLLTTAGDCESPLLLMRNSEAGPVAEPQPCFAALVLRRAEQTLDIDRAHPIQAEMSRCLKRLRLIDASCQEAPGRGGDAADRADVLCERARQIAARGALEAQLRQARRALRRNSAGQGAVCESCGVRIDPDRLDAIPAATLCVECQRKAENGHL